MSYSPFDLAHKTNKPRIAITGANGFLGWHTRVALRELGIEAVPIKLGKEFDLAHAIKAVTGAERVIHIAGINRASDDEIRKGNLLFADQLATAIRQAEDPPAAISYANSTQVSNDSSYGVAKARAGEVLGKVASEVDARFTNLELPNLFGEHGRPFYNAVTATFCHLLAKGESPTVQNDKELTLLHAQDAADLLIGSQDPFEIATLSHHESVSGLLGKLQKFSEIYENGEIPDTSKKFNRDLFNTYRSHTTALRMPITLARHADARGSFFETIRTHGGTGQTSFSTTVPNITRGNHFHRRKIERFVVLSGRARISLRRLFTSDVVHFDVTGESPVAVDMPTMWTHNITNTGSEMLYTMFWTNDLFDPDTADTIPEVV